MSHSFPSEGENSEGATEAPQVNGAMTRSQQLLARRRFLRRSMVVVGSISATAGVAGALHMLYPNLGAHFGDSLDVGGRADFPAALPEHIKLDHAGVFYQKDAKTFIVHLDRRTIFLAAKNILHQQLQDGDFIRDTDGSYWVALYQRCVHLGTPVAYRNECGSFKCPSHGAHYHCDGEYLDGPAPRSMDRFPLSIQNGRILIDTSRISQVPHPDPAQRLLAIPPRPCQ